MTMQEIRQAVRDKERSLVEWLAGDKWMHPTTRTIKHRVWVQVRLEVGGTREFKTHVWSKWTDPAQVLDVAVRHVVALHGHKWEWTDDSVLVRVDGASWGGWGLDAFRHWIAGTLTVNPI